MVLFDQRGTGRSSAPRKHGRKQGAIDTDASRWSFDAYLRDVEAVRESLQADQLHVLGVSWGGVLGMAYAIRHPTRVVSLTLVGPGAPDHELEELRREVYEPRLRELQAQGLIPRSPPTACTDQQAARLPLYFGDPEHPAASRPSGSVCTHGSIRSTFDALGDYTLALKDIRTPTLIFQGKQDYVVGEPLARAIAARIADAQLVLQDGCGHRVADECPEALFGALSSFWNVSPIAFSADAVPALDVKAMRQNQRRALALDREFQRSW